MRNATQSERSQQAEMHRQFLVQKPIRILFILPPDPQPLAREAVQSAFHKLYGGAALCAVMEHWEGPGIYADIRFDVIICPSEKRKYSRTAHEMVIQRAGPGTLIVGMP